MKQTLLLFILLITISCSGNHDNVTSPPSKASDKIADSTNRIRKEIAVTDSFFQITNISSGMIEFTPGPMRIVSEGDSVSLSHYSYEFDGGILTISTPLEKSNDYHTYPTSSDVVIHVSCPDLQAVAICSGGGFRCKHVLRGEKIQFGGMVGGVINVDSIECSQFRYESNGSTTSSFSHVKCEESQIFSTGNGDLCIGIESKHQSYLDISGESTVKANISSPLTQSIVETEGAVSYSLATDSLFLRATRGAIDLSGYAIHQDIRQSREVIIRNKLKMGK